MKRLNLKLLDSKKFNMAVIMANIIVIIGLVIYIVCHLNANDTRENADSQAIEVASTEMDAMLVEADNAMVDVYMALLMGANFEIEDGVKFHFGIDGTYSGYFDADNKNVQNYFYKVTLDSENHFILCLYSKEQDKSVEYIMSFNREGDIVLTYPGMNNTFVLKY